MKNFLTIALILIASLGSTYASTFVAADWNTYEWDRGYPKFYISGSNNYIQFENVYDTTNDCITKEKVACIINQDAKKALIKLLDEYTNACIDDAPLRKLIDLMQAKYTYTENVCTKSQTKREVQFLMTPQIKYNTIVKYIKVPILPITGVGIDLP